MKQVVGDYIVFSAHPTRALSVLSVLPWHL